LEKSSYTGNEKAVTRQELKNILGVLHYVKETALCRVFAGSTLAAIYCVRSNLELGAMFLREAIAAADGASEKQLDKKIYFDGSFDVPVQSVILKTRTHLDANLAVLMHNDGIDYNALGGATARDLWILKGPPQ
jgi:hypothetical protein